MLSTHLNQEAGVAKIHIHGASFENKKSPTGMRPLLCYFRKMKRAATFLIAVLILASCGAGKAVMDTGKSFDRYSCMSRDFKGQSPCPASPPPDYYS
ncbi:hypothetical protein HBA92_18395 [Ochrobactrum sp. MR28]|nr:hypothetical protein [Ochrobactrum sp. MR28]MBX8818870.1 hypothetical protein [Ochrobactrum sp. MR31]